MVIYTTADVAESLIRSKIFLINIKPPYSQGILTVVLFSSTDFPGGSVGKASACNSGDPSSIPGLGRSPEEGNGNPFQYSCLENPMDGGA